MPMTPKEIVKILEANGLQYVSSNGSHQKYRNHKTGKTTIVPFHAKDLKPGTEKHFEARGAEISSDTEEGLL